MLIGYRRLRLLRHLFIDQAALNWDVIVKAHMLSMSHIDGSLLLLRHKIVLYHCSLVFLMSTLDCILKLACILPDCFIRIFIDVCSKVN